MEDEQLVRQLKEGNQLAFTNIYRLYAVDAYTLAYKYLCNKELAEDAVQNLFFKLWQKRASLDETRPLNHFLFTILKHDLLNTLRDNKSSIFVLDDCLDMLLNVTSANADEEIDALLEQKEQIEVLAKALRLLSPQKQKILSLKITGKYSNQEIADKLNLSVNTIKFQYSQSLKDLRELVRKVALDLLL